MTFIREPHAGKNKFEFEMEGGGKGTARGSEQKRRKKAEKNDTREICGAALRSIVQPLLSCVVLLPAVPVGSFLCDLLVC